MNTKRGKCLALPSSNHGFCTSPPVLGSVLSPLHYAFVLDSVREAKNIRCQSLDLENLASLPTAVLKYVARGGGRFKFPPAAHASRFPMKAFSQA